MVGNRCVLRLFRCRDRCNGSRRCAVQFTALRLKLDIVRRIVEQRVVEGIAIGRNGMPDCRLFARGQTA